MSNFSDNSSDIIIVQYLYADKNYAVAPGDISQGSGRIRVWTKVTTSSGIPIAGIHVGFKFSPSKSSYRIYDMDLAPIGTGGLVVVSSNAMGIASVYLVSDNPACVLASAAQVGGAATAPVALYFGALFGNGLSPSWQAPTVAISVGTHYSKISNPSGFPVLPNAGIGQLVLPASGAVMAAATEGSPPTALRTFPVQIPRSAVSGSPDSQFFLVLNDQIAIPGKPSKGVVNVPYSDVLLDPLSNQMAYFIQDSSGQISQSETIGFGATGVYQNEPDATQTERRAPAPQVTPDPGNNGEITLATIEANYGLQITVPQFSLNDIGEDITSLSAEVYFYMNGFSAGTDAVRPGRMYTVPVGNLPITGGTTVSGFTATLPWPYAYGWSKPLTGSPRGPLKFYCEYILRDQSDQAYISKYISNNEYIIFLNTA
ncbi:hypothetical protein GCM10011491_46700 [Brucella endophytica]|uniref:Uncharacterized protein n=1 Tax=Brucella endophytica TaxID=1963359 RepID=A0A916SUA5_9HYPH|nr:hypothetical protein [Brucella endophytica]GGB13691.1 hypothetical protein GCM10011491_46700 [Brucella endophytica]